MKRRPLLVSGAALMAAPHIVLPQPAGKVWQIGNLTPYPRPRPPAPSLPIFDAYDQEMRRNGFVEGQNFVWHERDFSRTPDLMGEMARELVRIRVDVLCAVGGPAALVANKVAGPIPVLFVSVPDPVGQGLVKNLARPGGNITGTSSDVTPAFYEKHVELLKEIVPSLSRMAVFTDSDRSTSLGLKHVRQAVKTLGVEIQELPIREARDYDAAFAAMKNAHADGLLVLGIISTINPRRVTFLAAQHQVPAIYVTFLQAVAGGLITYHPDTVELARRSASQLSKILHGTKPGDIPVEQPDKFRLVINLNTAKALGITIPQSLLLRADEVIQ